MGVRSNGFMSLLKLRGNTVPQQVVKKLQHQYVVDNPYDPEDEQDYDVNNFNSLLKPNMQRVKLEKPHNTQPVRVKTEIPVKVEKMDIEKPKQRTQRKMRSTGSQGKPEKVEKPPVDKKPTKEKENAVTIQDDPRMDVEKPEPRKAKRTARSKAKQIEPDTPNKNLKIEEVEPTKMEIEPKPKVPAIEPKPKVPEIEPAQKKMEIEPKPKVPAIEPAQKKMEIEPKPKVPEIEPAQKKMEIEPKPKVPAIEPAQKKMEIEPKPKVPEIEPAQKKMEIEPAQKKMEIEDKPKVPEIESQPKLLIEAPYHGYQLMEIEQPEGGEVDVIHEKIMHTPDGDFLVKVDSKTFEKFKEVLQVIASGNEEDQAIGKRTMMRILKGLQKKGKKLSSDEVKQLAAPNDVKAIEPPTENVKAIEPKHEPKTFGTSPEDMKAIEQPNKKRPRPPDSTKIQKSLGVNSRPIVKVSVKKPRFNEKN
jgi:hypothetical protein